MSSHGWNGADPTQQFESGVDYELGTHFRAEADISVTAVRVWHGANSGDLAGRKGRLWSSVGVELTNVAMPNQLPSGWTEYTLASPQGFPAGTTFWVSYSTLSYYGAVTGVSYPVSSADGLVTALGQALHDTPGSFPTSVFGSSFYGIDVVYSAGLPGSNPLTATLTVVTNGLSAVATFGADRTATYQLEWGDGATVNTSSTTASHTYTAPGAYPVLLTATATDDGTVDAAAVIAYATLTGLDVDAIINAAVSHAMGLGVFDGGVIGHEPKSAPGNGLTAAFWIDAIDPIPAQSGLATTTARLLLSARIYGAFLAKPEDDIDPRLARAAVALMAAYSGDFDLAGTVESVDLLGRHGQALRGRAGYLNLDGKIYRVFTITIPVIVNDVFTQVM